MSDASKRQALQVPPDVEASSVQPLYDRILVKRLPAEDKTSSGLIIPDTAQDKSWKGEVLALGTWYSEGRSILLHGKEHFLSAKEFNYDGLEVGDMIIFGRYSGADMPDKFRMDGDECIILRDDEVLAIVED